MIGWGVKLGGWGETASLSNLHKDLKRLPVLPDDILEIGIEGKVGTRYR